jgi:hypothetical protein
MYDNSYVPTATLTASTTNALFPLTNINDNRRSKVWRSTTNSDNIVINFGSAKEVDSFFIVCDKRGNFGFSTITLEFNSTDSWGSPAATESITFSNTFKVGLKDFATKNYQYVRIVLTSSLGYCEVSNIYLGKRIDMDRSISFDWTYKSDDLSNSKTNRYGQRFTDETIRQTTISGALRLLDKDQLDQFFSVYDNVGEKKPFFIQLGCDEMTNDNRRYSGMVYFSSLPQITNTSFNRYNLSMTLIEAT